MNAVNPVNPRGPVDPQVSEGLAIAVRPATTADLSFILSSWKKSYRSSEFGRRMRTTVYFASHGRTIEAIVSRCNVLVACNPDDPDQIYGFVCFEQPDVVHFVYTKRTYRALGVATRLLNATGLDLGSPLRSSHRTDAVEAATARGFVVEYDPHLCHGVTS